MKDLIVVRGGGDLATGTIYKLKKSGFLVLILEVANPSAIRRNVAFCEAVYQGTQTVEDMTCYLAESLEQAEHFLLEGKLAVLVDPIGEAIPKLQASAFRHPTLMHTPRVRSPEQYVSPSGPCADSRSNAAQRHSRLRYGTAKWEASYVGQGRQSKDSYTRYGRCRCGCPPGQWRWYRPPLQPADIF